MSLYKLVTTENVDLNYKAFEKYELIDCISNLRTTYFRLKKENEEVEQLKEVIDKAIEYSNQIIEDTKSFYRPTKDIIYSGDTLIDIAEENIKILKGDSNE